LLGDIAGRGTLRRKEPAPRNRKAKTKHATYRQKSTHVVLKAPTDATLPARFAALARPGQSYNKILWH
jgi:hypothetical protein